MSENLEPARGEGDDVAALLRSAGRRRSVPDDRLERVREVARDEWRREVRRRSRKRAAWIGAGAAAAVAAGWLWLAAGSGAPGAAIRVEALFGSARSRGVLAVGDEIRIGSRVTTDAEGRAALRIAGHSVRLDGSTTIRLLDPGSMALERGALYVDSGVDGAALGRLAIRTPFGVIEETGTQFEVRLDSGAVRLRLREGAVVLHRGGHDEEVRAGGELTVRSDGSASRATIAIHGAEWDWITDVTPMLDLEGKSAREFLDWVARERGLRLEFEDAAVAGSAGATVLGGRLAGLTVEQALDAVLPTCRLRYRVEEGVLGVAAD